MSSWDYEHAYPGAPMVKVKGFPRPLYPPDASGYGKKPSVNGPDVTAYKRTVSRAGRWPWQTFDDTYSNGFAHGTSGNVGDTGVSGVQRQQDIDDTGWLGQNTFNTLRSIVIPDGLPHAGEMAMDATAVNLINQAWDKFEGHEPSPPDKSSIRQQALSRAVKEIGVKESPPNSNQVKYTDWYNMVGPWCAMFVSWCFVLGADDLNKNSGTFERYNYYSYVPYIVGDARSNRNGLKTVDVYDAIPGDVICYDWNWDGQYDHTGIFEKWQSYGQMTVIEGNTSPQNDTNGGEVMRRVRAVSSQGTVCCRVAE